MGMSSVAVKKRRTQEERSTTTRTRFLDAAIECLIELGYANTTTTEIAIRAGLSRGAQLHHFPTKVELVTSAVEHLAKRRIEDLRGATPNFPIKADISQVADTLWSAFSGPLFYAALELWVAARTDSELHAALYPVEQRIGQAIYQSWQEFYGDIASEPRFRLMMQMTIYMMRGMALERILKNDDRHRRAVLKTWKQIMTEVLEEHTDKTEA